MKSQFAVSLATYASIIMFLMITAYGFARPPQKGKVSQKPTISHERKSPETRNFRHGRSRTHDATTTKTLHRKMEGRSGKNHPGYRGRNSNRGARDDEAMKQMEIRKALFKAAMKERLTCPKCGHVKEMPKRPEFHGPFGPNRPIKDGNENKSKRPQRGPGPRIHR